MSEDNKQDTEQIPPLERQQEPLGRKPQPLVGWTRPENNFGLSQEQDQDDSTEQVAHRRVHPTARSITLSILRGTIPALPDYTQHTPGFVNPWDETYTRQYMKNLGRDWIYGWIWLIVSFGIPVAGALYGSAQLPQANPLHRVLDTFAAATVVIWLSLVVLRVLRGSSDAAVMRNKVKLQKPVEQPSKRTIGTLNGRERVLREVRAHPISQTPFWVMTTATIGLLIGIPLAGFSPISLGIFIGWSVIVIVGVCFLIPWYYNVNTLTTVRVTERRGWLKQQARSLWYDQITDLKVEIPWQSEVLTRLRILSTRYGTIKLSYAGEQGSDPEDLLDQLNDIGDIDAVSWQLTQRMQRTAKDSNDGT